MAPTAPKKRTSLRSKASNPTSKTGSGLIARPANTHREGAVISDSFVNSKKDKRTIKHSAFVNRIEKAQKKPLKRRRPNKKLVTTLEGLADALPDMEDLVDGEDRVEGGKIKMKGMKSRPGATKRREKLERMERERFGKNMAQLSAGSVAPLATESTVSGSATASSATSSRWAALRGFISQTLEQKDEFKQ
ncbi:hypothetical protein BP5796_09224 [Coleophoma crateriformis]|uniref:Ribosome biogenesis protein SLX9 n=1 Tax=Coleophoma crateriformis TaxID=565419 RepID=A0A3D8R3H1_9HELO|nr:hypothetical protein BP5796_09224 [Coleophoma crateriformis]